MAMSDKDRLRLLELEEEEYNYQAAQQEPAEPITPQAQPDLISPETQGRIQGTGLQMAERPGTLVPLAEKGIAAADYLSGGRISSLGRGEGFNPSETDTASRVMSQPLGELESENLSIAKDLQSNPEYMQGREGGQSVMQIGASIANPAAGIISAVQQGGAEGGAKEAAFQALTPVALKVAGKGLGIAGKIAAKYGDEAVTALGLRPIVDKATKAISNLPNSVLAKRMFNKAGFKKFASNGVKAVEKGDESVKLLKNEGLFSKGSSFENMDEAVGEIKGRVGKRIGEIKQQLGKQTDINLGDLADDVQKIEDDFAGTKFENEAKAVDKSVDDLLKLADNQYNIPLEKLINEKTALGRKAWAQNPTEDLTPYQRMYWVVSDAIEKAADKIGGSVGAELRHANKVYNAADRMEVAIGNKILDRATSRGFSLSNMVAGGLGLASGGGLTPAGFAAAAKTIAAKEYLEARGAQDLSRILSSGNRFKKLGKYAPMIQESLKNGTFAARHFILNSQDQEYREKMKEALESSENE